MTGFSIGETATSGFRLIRRRPLAVLAWGLFLYVVMLLPTLALLAWMAPTIGAFMQMSHASPTPEAFLPLQAKMMAINPILQLLALFCRAVLVSAVFRAVLEPEKSRFGYLRVGVQELWVGLVMLVVGILLVIAIIAAAIPVGIIAAVLGVTHQTGPAILAAVVGGLVILIGLVWLALRFSMATPLSFAQRRFALFESWALTKGQSGRLFLVFLLVVVLIWLMELVVVAVLGGILVGIAFGVSGGLPFSPPNPEAFFSRPPAEWLPTVAPIVLAVGLVYSLLIGLFVAIALAPLAEAYKALAAGVVKEPGVA